MLRTRAIVLSRLPHVSHPASVGPRLCRVKPAQTPDKGTMRGVLNPWPAKFGLATLLAVVLLSRADALAKDRLPGDPGVRDRLMQAFVTEEQRNGPNSPNLLPMLDQMARQQFREGDLAGVAGLRRRAIEIATRTYGSDSP